MKPVVKHRNPLPPQLVRHPNWRWSPGTRVLQGHGLPPARVDDNGMLTCGGKVLRIAPGDLPDLSDPGTIGGLLTLLGAPTTLPCDWICEWHARKRPVGDILAEALLRQWGADPE